MAFKFRQDSNFWYLSGVNEPSAILVIDNKETYLIMPEMSEYQRLFDGQMGSDSIASISGINEVLAQDAGWQRLKKRLTKTKQVYTIAPPPDFLDAYGLYANPARRELNEKLRATHQSLEVVDVREELGQLRMVKQPAELKALQAAIDLTIDGLEMVRGDLFTNEKDIETALTVYFLQHGNHAHGYGPLVMAGKNACLLHYENGQAPIGQNELVLLDVGVEVEGYTADITRAFMYGTPSKRQLEVHAAVLAVHAFALQGIKPGVTIRENERRVEAYMGEQLIKLGLIKKPDREAIRRYFPHATSHYLGLDAHDLGDYDAPLKPNMVLTVEPGIYIPEEGIGIRIEDDVLVTKTGHKVMSQRLPRGLI